LKAVLISPDGIAPGGKTHLTGKAQFEQVYGKGRSWAAEEIVVRALPNGLGATRYGLTVSRRVGRAVVRNRIKRRLREILRRMKLAPGWDLIVIARRPAAGADFATLGRSVGNLLVRAGLFMGEHEGNRPGTD
jgi:ribonuclease P protein component